MQKNVCYSGSEEQILRWVGSRLYIPLPFGGVPHAGIINAHRGSERVTDARRETGVSWFVSIGVGTYSDLTKEILNNLFEIQEIGDKT